MSDDPASRNQRNAALVVVLVYGGLMVGLVALLIWAIVSGSMTTLWVLGGLFAVGAIQPLYYWIKGRRR